MLWFMKIYFLTVNNNNYRKKSTKILYCVLYNLYVVLYTSWSYLFSLLDSLRAQYSIPLSLSPFLSAYYLLHHIWGPFRMCTFILAKKLIWNDIYFTSSLDYIFLVFKVLWSLNLFAYIDQNTDSQSRKVTVVNGPNCLRNPKFS